MNNKIERYVVFDRLNAGVDVRFPRPMARCTKCIQEGLKTPTDDLVLLNKDLLCKAHRRLM